MNPYDVLGKQFSFLVLDFNRPEETFWCLESIKRHVKFSNYEVVLLSNGGEQSYVWDFYNRGLIDKCILSKRNEGSGFGVLRLTDFCSTEYFALLQCDNFIKRDFTQGELDQMKAALSKETDIAALDLTGLIPKHPFSERAFVTSKSNYCNNPLQTGGGTGPFQGSELKGTETAAHEWFAQNNKRVLTVTPWLIGDIGKYAVIELKCGGILKRRCDTHQVWVIKPPKEPVEMWHINDSEWAQIIAGTWKGGTVPENAKPHVFFYYSNEMDPC